MILFSRTADIAPGQLVPAVGFAKKVSAYLASEYGLKIDVSVPVGGNAFSLHWTTTFPNLQQFEDVNAKLMQDPKYIDMVSTSASSFIAGTTRDALYKTI